jgi:protein SCO1/2
VLVDKEKRIRGYYNGTDKDEVNNLLRDINRLKKEYKN